MRLADFIANTVSPALRPPAVAQPVPLNAVQTPGTGFDLADTFETAPVSGPVLAPASSAWDQPRPVETPSEDYYQQRYDDFVRRNPGVTPPDYYLDYGQKYLDRFSDLGEGDLTPEGLAWRDRTLENLQNAIEELRVEDPQAFAELERDPEAFREFAYETHPDAYTEAGLFELPVQDLIAIATTPDLRDILTEDGLRQTLEVISRVRPEDIPDIARETFQEALDELRDRFPDIPFPNFPNIPGLPGFPNLPGLPNLPGPGIPDLPNLPDLPDLPDVSFPDLPIG